MPKVLTKAQKAKRVVKSKIRSKAGKRAALERATSRVRTKSPGAASRALRG